MRRSRSRRAAGKSEAEAAAQGEEQRAKACAGRGLGGFEDQKGGPCGSEVLSGVIPTERPGKQAQEAQGLGLQF